MRTQALDLFRRLVEARLQRRVLFLHAAGGDGERFDQVADLAGFRLVGQLAARAFQGAAVFRRADLGERDGAVDRHHLLGQMIAGVADLIVQAQTRQMLDRQLLGHGVGEHGAQRHESGDFLRDGAVRLADQVKPELEVERSRPDLGLLHLVEGGPRQIEGFAAADGGVDLI